MELGAQTLGQKIHALRMRKGMTQIELAKGIVTPSMISQLEADKARPSYKVLSAIADRLEVPMDMLLANVNLNLEVVSAYKWARALLASKEYSSAIPLFLDLLNDDRAQVPKLEIMQGLGECYLYAGQLEEAERLFQKMHETALLQADHHVATRVIRNLGMIEFNRKQYQLAIYQWQRALDLLEKEPHPDEMLKANILYNLGLAHRCVGQIGVTITFYAKAEEIYHRVNTPEEIGKVFMGLGQAHRMLHHFEQAIEYTEKAIALFECMENINLTLKTQVSTAAIYAENGREQEAETLLKAAIEKFHAYENREGEGIATVELAKLKLRLDQVEAAEDLCQRARIRLPDMHLYQGYVNQTLGQIALMRKDQETALKFMSKSADCFKAFGELAEWDATMYLIVQVHQDNEDYVKAFHVLDEIRRNSLLVLEQRGIVL